MVNIVEVENLLRQKFKAFKYDFKQGRNENGACVQMTVPFTGDWLKTPTFFAVLVDESFRTQVGVCFGMLSETYYSKKLLQEYNASSRVFHASISHSHLCLNAEYTPGSMDDFFDFVSECCQEFLATENNPVAKKLIDITSKV